MSDRTFKNTLLCLLVLLFVTACDRNKEQRKPPFAWGKAICYDDFLWEKHTPDTLYRTLTFDFNEDARLFMDRPAVVGVFKRTDADRYEPVTEQEAQLFLDGIPCPGNQIAISSRMQESRLGIVFNNQAENKMHYWYLKVVDDGGLDRINDLEMGVQSDPDKLLMDFQIEKCKIWNPLAKFLTLVGLLLLALLIVWMCILRPMLYPSFKVGKINMREPAPFITTHRLRGCRRLVLTNRKEKQNVLSRIFTRPVKYDVNALWTSPVVFSPYDKKSVKIRTTNEYSIEARTLKINQEYTLVNNKTKTKTIIIIS